jgi:glycosyltransferase involved in cell wall biosynthesis
MTPTLSVVMPVFNEAEHLPATIDALVAALAETDFDAELVLVDDGSTDGSADVARSTVDDRLSLAVVAQPNRGRVEARRAGLESARGDWVLLLDGRVRLRPDSLSFLESRLPAGERVWNGHVHVETAGNPYGAFWNLLAESAWRTYFADPRTTSFDAVTFDLYPKGTGCFVAPRALLLESVEAYSSGYADLRRANDDTPLLRWISERERIHISPSFACDYAPRGDLASFVRHSIHRGTVFLDGHGRRESRFFPAVVLFFPLSAALVLASLRRPTVVPAAGVALALAAGGTTIALRRSPAEAASAAALAPVYALAHGAGMWRGLALMARSRLGRGNA